MPPLHRIIIKTHHMTSRKKILHLSKAAKKLSCAVLLKTGAPPGIMLAEGVEARGWMEVVRKLRYKDYRLLREEEVKVEMGEGLERVGLQMGEVREVDEIKEFARLLGRDEEVLRWWKEGMGYVKDGDDVE